VTVELHELLTRGGAIFDGFVFCFVEVVNVRVGFGRVIVFFL